MNEFKKTDNGNLEYADENGIYTLVDMGEYVGHASRDVFDKVYSCWRLMFYEGKNNNFPINISALVDSTGSYTRIMINGTPLFINNGNISGNVSKEMQKCVNSFIKANDLLQKKLMKENLEDEKGKTH